MSAVDGEHIAPVTYLFGATRAPQGDDGSALHSSSPVAATEALEALEAPSGPRFADLGEPAPAKTPRELKKPSASDKSSASEKTSATEKRNAPDKPSATEKPKGSFDRISNVSMYALARRGMSRREMRDYLLGREFEATEVDDEIERLEQVALLDDLALAETLIRTLQSRKGLGRSALTAELRRRNIDQVAIESALTVLDDDDELDRATAIAVKRAGQLRALDATTAKRRLGDFLMRRGYSGSVVSKAVQQALAPSGPSFR